MPKRIETHIVQPHRNPALQAAARGLAVANCGRWPVSAILDAYQDAVDRLSSRSAGSASSRTLLPAVRPPH